MTLAHDARELLVRRAARALGNAGLVNAYGHCSSRIDEATFLVCAPQPMGLVAPGEPGTIVAVEGPLPAGVLGEVRVHQQIYRRRPEVGGIARTIPPNVLALSAMRVTPQPAVDNAQMKIMKFMPVFFVLFYYNWPSAIALYSTVNGIFTISQQLVVNRMKDTQDPGPVVPGKPTKNVTPKKKG